MSAESALETLRADILASHEQLGTTPPADLDDPRQLLDEAARLGQALRARMAPISEELERLSLTKTAVTSYIRADRPEPRSTP